MFFSRIFVGTAAFLVCAAASAGVYRWVDSEGHVHYTDQAVANSEPVNVRTGHPNERAQPATTPLTGDALTQKKSDCEQKKNHYESYRSATKIVETDSLGRKHEFNTEETKLLLEKAQKDMQETCLAAGVTLSTGSEAAAANPQP